MASCSARPCDTERLLLGEIDVLIATDHTDARVFSAAFTGLTRECGGHLLGVLYSVGLQPPGGLRGSSNRSGGLLRHAEDPLGPKNLHDNPSPLRLSRSSSNSSARCGSRGSCGRLARGSPMLWWRARSPTRSWSPPPQPDSCWSVRRPRASFSGAPSEAFLRFHGAPRWGRFEPSFTRSTKRTPIGSPWISTRIEAWGETDRLAPRRSPISVYPRYVAREGPTSSVPFGRLYRILRARWLCRDQPRVSRDRIGQRRRNCVWREHVAIGNRIQLFREWR